MRGESLMGEAMSIVKALGILREAESLGEARLVGSVALDPVVKRDIDVHVLLPTDAGLVEAAFRMATYPLNHDDVEHIRLSDHRYQRAMKAAVDALPGPSGPWSLDVWLTIVQDRLCQG